MHTPQNIDALLSRMPSTDWRLTEWRGVDILGTSDSENNYYAYSRKAAIFVEPKDGKSAPYCDGCKIPVKFKTQKLIGNDTDPPWEDQREVPYCSKCQPEPSSLSVDVGGGFSIFD